MGQDPILLVPVMLDVGLLSKQFTMTVSSLSTLTLPGTRPVFPEGVARSSEFPSDLIKEERYDCLGQTQ